MPKPNPLNSVHAGAAPRVAADSTPDSALSLGQRVRNIVFSEWGVGLCLLSVVAIGVRFGAPVAAGATVIWLMFFTLIDWVRSASIGARASDTPSPEPQAPTQFQVPAPKQHPRSALTPALSAPIAAPIRQIHEIQDLIQALESRNQAAVAALLGNWESLPFAGDEERINALWKVFEEHVQLVRLQNFFLFAAPQILKAIKKLSKTALQRNPRMADPTRAPLLRAVRSANVRNVLLILQYCSISDDLYKEALWAADRGNEELVSALLSSCVGRSNLSLASFTETLYYVSAADRENKRFDAILDDLLQKIPPAITWEIVAEALTRAANDTRSASITRAVLYRHKIATSPDENSFSALFLHTYKQFEYPHGSVHEDLRKQLCQMDMPASTTGWAFTQARQRNDAEAVRHLLSKKRIIGFDILTTNPQTPEISSVVQAYIAQHRIIEETLDGFQTGALQNPDVFRKVLRHVYQYNRALLGTLRAKDVPALMAEVALEEASRNGDQETVDCLLSKKLIARIGVFNLCLFVFAREMNKFRSAVTKYVTQHQIVEETLDTLQAAGWTDLATFNETLSYIYNNDKRPLVKLRQMDVPPDIAERIFQEARRREDAITKAWAQSKKNAATVNPPAPQGAAAT